MSKSRREPRRYPLLYEIPARQWLHELSRRRGRSIRLGDVPSEEIERIADLGFDTVWLMGVWTTGDDAAAIARLEPGLQAEYLRALPDYRPSDCVGSPFSVAAYEVSRAFGGEQGLAKFRSALAERGVQLILDFVSNHVGRDHPWVDEEPGLFIQGTPEDLQREPGSFFANRQGVIIAHGRDPYFPAWTDTAQLHYGRRETRKRMFETLLSIAARSDGVRCDMAMLILPDVFDRVWRARLGSNSETSSFWAAAISAVRGRFPGYRFLGEAYWDLEWRLQEDGFDFTYDKRLYDRLVSGDHEGARRHLDADLAYQARSARFVENHDEPRAIAALGREGARSAAAVALFTPGLRLLFHGQLEGRRVKVPVQLLRGPAEDDDAEISRFYERLLAILRDPVFQGMFHRLEARPAGRDDASHHGIFVLLWTSGNETDGDAALIVVNRNDGTGYARVPFPSGFVLPARQYIFEDTMTGESYKRSGGELLGPGLFVELGPHQMHLFRVRSA